MTGIGTDAKGHSIAFTNAGVAGSLHHESGSIWQAGVYVGAWAQVLQGINGALQLSILRQSYVFGTDTQFETIAGFRVSDRSRDG